MPCKETECKCEYTQAKLIELGLDPFGNCKNPKCNHPVGNHTDASAAGVTITIREKFEKLLGERLNDAEWSELLHREKAMQLDALSTMSEARHMLSLFRQSVRTKTARQIAFNTGYYITSQTVPGHPNVQVGHDQGLREFVFKSFENLYSIQAEEKNMKFAHYGLPNPYVCKSLRILEQNGKHLLVMPKYGSSSNDILSKGHRLTNNQILLVTMSLAAGILPLHLQGMCWADIKPENVVIGPETRCVLVDAGSVCSFGARVRSTTPLYTLLVDAIGGSQIDMVCMATTLFQLMAPDLWEELLQDSEGRISHPGQPNKQSVRAKCQKFLQQNFLLEIVLFLLEEKDICSFILRFFQRFHNERACFEEPWQFVCSVLALVAGPFIDPTMFPPELMVIMNGLRL